MRKYRIIKETKEVTKEVDFFIEKKLYWFFYPLWIKETYYDSEMDSHFFLIFKTERAAKDWIIRKTQKITREIID